MLLNIFEMDEKTHFLCFCFFHNPNKLAEIKSAVNSFEVVGLKEMGIHEDIAETGNQH